MKVWSTDDVSEREKLAFWNDAVCDAFLRVGTECEERLSFHGRIASAPVGPLLLNRVEAQRHLVRRGRRGLSRDTEEWFFVNLHRTGACVLTQAGRDHIAGPGEITFHDSTRPFDFAFTENYALSCIIVPRAALIARMVNAADAVTRPLARDSAGALFRDFCGSFVEAAPTLSLEAAEQAGTIFIDLLALALGASGGAREIAGSSLHHALFSRICARIRACLSDPELDLLQVAAWARLAPRTLQTLFHEQGTTFTAYLLEQRLLLAERQLRAKRSVTVTEIAYATGFSDLSYFCRAFRRRFGKTASEGRGAVSCSYPPGPERIAPDALPR